MAEIDLIRENIEYEQLLGEGTADTVLRGEYLIPDTHPDLLEILTLDAKPIIINKDIMQDKVYVEGRIEYNILYLSKEEEKMAVQSVGYSDKFSNYIDISGAEHNMDCEAECYIEHIEASIMNERKVNLEGIIKLKVDVFKNYQYEVVKDIDSSENVQMLKKPYIIDKIVENSFHYLDAKSTMKVSMDKPQIGKILKHDLCIHKKDTKVFDNKIQISAFAKIEILYRGMDTRDVFYLDDDVYISQDIDIEGLTPDMQCMSDFLLDNIDLDIKQDDLGENRIVDAEAKIKVNVKVINKEKFDVIEDAYSSQCLMELCKEKYNLNVLHGHNYCDTIVKENIELDKEAPIPVQILMCSGEVCITDKKLVENKAVVDGVVNVDVLYRSNDDSRYLHKVSEEIPFNCSVDIPGTKIDMLCFSKAFVDNIEANIEANTIGIKAIVKVCAKVTYTTEKEFLVSINKLEEAIPDKKASITIYVVQPGDTLWNIAKRYFTCVDEIVKINNIENADLIKPGDKIIIPGRAII